MYKVIHSFKDLKDNKYVYKVGKKYPREGYETSKKRIKELSTNDNKIGEILIMFDENVEVEFKEEDTVSTENEEIESSKNNDENVEVE